VRGDEGRIGGIAAFFCPIIIWAVCLGVFGGMPTSLDDLFIYLRYAFIVVFVVASVVAIGVAIFGTLGILFGGELHLSRRRRRLDQHHALQGDKVLHQTPRTLYWMCRLLPKDEAIAWLTEVASSLAEAGDKGTRRRYIYSYLRTSPLLIWTSWIEYLRDSYHKELS